MPTTIVVWAPESPSEANRMDFNDKVREMLKQGKIVNEPVRSQQGDNTVITREWTTLTDAQEWIAFVQQFGPISTNIID